MKVRPSVTMKRSDCDVGVVDRRAVHVRQHAARDGVPDVRLAVCGSAEAVLAREVVARQHPRAVGGRRRCGRGAGRGGHHDESQNQQGGTASDGAAWGAHNPSRSNPAPERKALRSVSYRIVMTPGPSRSNATLALLAFAMLIVSLDQYIVVVALPEIGRELGYSAQTLQSVISAYAVASAGFLLLGGRAADLLGPPAGLRRRPRALRRRLARRRARAGSGGPARRPRGPGPRRRARLPRHPVAGQHHVRRGRGAQPRPGGLGRRRRGRAS